MKHCQICKTKRALVRKINGEPLCRDCFFASLEEEVHATIQKNNMFPKKHTRVAIGASGGKDSTALVHILSSLNKKHGYGLDLHLLSIDEGISPYRDDSLKTVRENSETYSLPLTVLSYKELFGWTLDEIVQKTGPKQSCMYCGALRRQALDRGASLIGAEILVTGHNADDIAETLLLNFIRGDIRRLHTCGASATLGSSEIVPRAKPFKYTTQKEIVLYAYLKKLDYFSTECSYATDSARGDVRTLIQKLNTLDLQTVHNTVVSAERIFVPEKDKRRKCGKCNAVSAGELCHVCALIDGLSP
ncbi:MAG: ATP-binding domain-containing protein 3 [Amphiamblys sp. WSBS2006]|nr:MAG: ATP-binding domain-containing protein 3 [Amphiamblys sp. WSBS2006]